jgi:hypothetical protein
MYVYIYIYKLALYWAREAKILIWPVQFWLWCALAIFFRTHGQLWAYLAYVGQRSSVCPVFEMRAPRARFCVALFRGICHWSGWSERNVMLIMIIEENQMWISQIQRGNRAYWCDSTELKMLAGSRGRSMWRREDKWSKLAQKNSWRQANWKI